MEGSLLTEQRNDGLRVIIRHIGLVKAVEHAQLFLIRQLNLCQALHGQHRAQHIGIALHQVTDKGVRILVLLIFYMHQRTLCRRVYLHTHGAARSILLQGHNLIRFSADSAQRQVVALIGKEHVAIDACSGSQLGKGIDIVVHGSQQLLFHCLQEVTDTCLSRPLAIDGQCFHHHVDGTNGSYAVATIIDGSKECFWLVGIGTQHFTEGSNSQDIGRYALTTTEGIYCLLTNTQCQVLRCKT